MSTAYLNIGTNLGDRLSNLEQAVALLERLTGSRARLSRVIESEPWGYASPHPYLNIGVALPCDCDPERLLDLTQRVERLMGSATHRSPTGEYIDRVIDIDIIDIPGVRIDTPRLTIPHPRRLDRPFVMIPLQELLQSAPSERPIDDIDDTIIQ